MVVLVCVLFSATAAVLMFTSRGSTHQAAGSAEQLVRIHEIKTLLLEADAASTTSFLSEGQNTAHHDAVARASSLVVEAAREQPADQEALSRLNAAIADYNAATGLAHATTHDRNLGATYLYEASDELHADAIVVVDELIATNGQRVADQATTVAPWLVIALQVVPVTVTGCVLFLVAKRFRRVVNLGLTAAVLALIASTIIATSATLTVSQEQGRITAGSLHRAVAVAEARSSAYDGQAYQNLTLILADRAATYEPRMSAAVENVGKSLASLPERQVSTLWDRYLDRHEEIEELRSGGKPEAAVALALAPETGETFGEFIEHADTTLDDSSESAIIGLDTLSTQLITAGITTGGLGLSAAALAAWGLSVRLKEYQ